LAGVVRVLPVVPTSDRGGITVGTQTGVVLAESEDGRGDRLAEGMTVRASLTARQAFRSMPSVDERLLRRIQRAQRGVRGTRDRRVGVGARLRSRQARQISAVWLGVNAEVCVV